MHSWDLEGFCHFLDTQTSELTFRVYTSLDTQQLSTSTSCAGGEPGPDSSLAWGRRTHSLLLCLHHDVVSWDIKKKHTVVTLFLRVGCHRACHISLVARKKLNKPTSSGSIFVVYEAEKYDPPHLLGEYVCSDPPLGSTLSLTENSQSQRSGCILTSDILTSSGRAKGMGTLARNRRGSNLKDG